MTSMLLWIRLIREAAARGSERETRTDRKRHPLEDMAKSEDKAWSEEEASSMFEEWRTS
jgi:hypothetical protein